MNKDSKTVKTVTASENTPPESDNDVCSNGEGVAFDDGRWHAATLGHLASLLIDSGNDSAILFRVVGDGPFLESGAFARRWEIITIPNGLVRAMLRQYGVNHAHKTLKAYLEAGLVT
jgi:hypothetical protein